MTPVARDPLEVPIEEKVALLLRDERSGAEGARRAVRELRAAAAARGEDAASPPKAPNVTQTFIRVGPSFSATAVGDGDFQSYDEELAPRGSGWEYIESLDMPGNAERWASLAVEKLSAQSRSRPGRYDLILDPTNLWLTIHESIGHPTELDRAIGYEANYAGTSFVAPPEKMIGQLKYGPTFMNIQADRTQEGSLARVAWDDEGVPADKWLLIEKGIFKDYQTTREQAARISEAHRRDASRTAARSPSRGTRCSSSACRTSRCCPATRTSALDDIVAATDRGIVIKNRGSWSIDHQRYNFQFSGQVFYEVKGGKIVGMLQGRRVPGEHAGVLELDGHDRRQELLLARRRVQRRQGRAAQIELGEPRLRAGALPQRQHPQHREGAHDARRPVFGCSTPSFCRATRRRRSPIACCRSRKADETRVQHHQRLERQHALRRRRDHHVGRHHRHDASRSRRRSASAARRRRRTCSTMRRLQAHGRSRRAPREAVARRSGADAGARPADLSRR